LNNEENISTEELMPMDSISVGTHDCSCEEDDADFQPVVELQSENRDNAPLKSLVNGLSYKKLLGKEDNFEAENKIMVSNDSKKVEIVRKSKLNVKDKLKEVRDHIYSSLQVFMSLLKYVKFVAIFV